MPVDIGNRGMRKPQAAALPCLGIGGRVESGFLNINRVVGV
jgi:hypothetical protein